MAFYPFRLEEMNQDEDQKDISKLTNIMDKIVRCFSTMKSHIEDVSNRSHRESTSPENIPLTFPHLAVTDCRTTMLMKLILFNQSVKGAYYHLVTQYKVIKEYYQPTPDPQYEGRRGARGKFS